MDVGQVFAYNVGQGVENDLGDVRAWKRVEHGLAKILGP